MAYYPWQAQYWTQGNFNPNDAAAADTLTVGIAFTVSDSGTAKDRDGNHPGLYDDGSVGADQVAVTGFNEPVLSGTNVWDDSGPNHLEVHFLSQAVSESYATALAAATSADAAAAVVKNYRDHAVGGYWGTLEVAPS